MNSNLLQNAFVGFLFGAEVYERLVSQNRFVDIVDEPSTLIYYQELHKVVLKYLKQYCKCLLNV